MWMKWLDGIILSPAKILKCNGGPIYMDEQFTPFWGEDSDFCYQIKLLNKKCGIIGKGAIAHKWSSCDKQDTRKSLYENVEETGK